MVSLFMIIRNYSLLQSLAFGVGSGLGWTLAIVTMAAIRKLSGNRSKPWRVEIRRKGSTPIIRLIHPSRWSAA